MKLNRHIQKYIDLVENEEILVSEEVHLLILHIKECFEKEKIYVAEEQADKLFGSEDGDKRGITKYFPWSTDGQIALMPWEEFLLTLWICTYYEDIPENGDFRNQPRWDTLFCYCGRGSGKTGLLSLASIALTSNYNNGTDLKDFIREYDVDIISNNLDQATVAVREIGSAFSLPGIDTVIKPFYEWTKEQVKNKITGGVISPRTSSSNTADGRRSGAIFFDEIHAFQEKDYKRIQVYTSGLGKKKHPRRLFVSSNGYVRESVLDHYLDISEGILRDDEADERFLPFICKLDSKEEIEDEKCWQKAIPSYPYRKNVRLRLKDDFREWKRDPIRNSDFFVKKMQLWDGNVESAVTSEENLIQATSRPIPFNNLRGKDCVVGIDASDVNDWCSVTFLFRIEETYYSLCHTWVNISENNKSLAYLKCPYKEWAKEGFITLVDSKVIYPNLLINYIKQNSRFFNIKRIAGDSFNLKLFEEGFKSAGFEKKIYYARPSDLQRVTKLVEFGFATQTLIMGVDVENAKTGGELLRWSVRNTKSIPASKNLGGEYGNRIFTKQSRDSGRKNDSFMSLCHAFTVVDELDGKEHKKLPTLKALTW